MCAYTFAIDAAPSQEMGNSDIEFISDDKM